MTNVPFTGLGFTASGPRDIKPGLQYEKYFDKSGLIRSDQILLHGTTFDTLSQMAGIVKQTLDDTKAISKVLEGRTRKETAQNIWNFLYDHIDYVRDSIEFEELRRPLRTWADRKGDCDCYSIFASSVLTNLGIDHAFRMTGYKGDYQHVYVIVPYAPNGNLKNRMNYIVIDPVTDQFDHEVLFKKKFDKVMKMPIKYLNGIDSELPVETVTYSYPVGFEFASFGHNTLGYTGRNATELAEDFINRLRLHIINTYEELSEMDNNPAVNQLRDQIDMLLQVWHDPISRDTLLNQLSTPLNGLSGLKDWFGKIKEGIQKVGHAINDGWDKVRSIAEQHGYQIIQTNPVNSYDPGNFPVYRSGAGRPDSHGTAYDIDRTVPPQRQRDNTSTWLWLGAAGIATYILLGTSTHTKPAKKERKAALSGAPKKANQKAATSGTRSGKSVPTMVMN